MISNGRENRADPYSLLPMDDLPEELHTALKVKAAVSGKRIL